MTFRDKYPVLNFFSMILVNNNRSKAYLQNLIKNKFVPTFVIILNSGNKKMPDQTEHDVEIYSETSQRLIRNCDETNISFDEKEHIRRTLDIHEIPYHEIDSLDINSPEVIGAVQESPCDYMVYSGPGGAILRKEIIGCGKYFIHAHPGILPQFRGSTIPYYSILKDGTVGCSIILMAQKVDQGPVFHQRAFRPTLKNDFDYVFDPSMRAATLIDFFYKYYSKSMIPLNNSNQVGVDHYIIHPLLKHLSIISLEKRLK